MKYYNISSLKSSLLNIIYFSKLFSFNLLFFMLWVALNRVMVFIHSYNGCLLAKALSLFTSKAITDVTCIIHLIICLLFVLPVLCFFFPLCFILNKYLPFLCFFFFFLFGSLVDWMMPTYIGEDYLFYSVPQFKF